MLESFASGYFLRPYWVVPDGEDDGVINDDEYQQMKSMGYDDDSPILMKMGNSHFEVSPDSSVPLNTLRVNESVIKSSSVKTPPEFAPVLVTKPGYNQYFKFFSGDPNESQLR